ncbi:MAG: efflux RND transporter permease subunit [Candidatus Krumholzibacteriota bacterium]|nr:efflux RND transporter permease subunit [Candidatus Krumholzibacteriota bacterium]
MIGNLIINRKILISMIFIAATMLGIVSYRMLPVELFPNAELPFLIVQAYSYQEADPGDMERDVIIPLEGAIGTLENIDRIESAIYPRSGMINVFYNKGTGLKYAYLKLQEKISTARSSLPDNYFVQVFKVDTEQISNQFMNLQVRGGGGLDRVRQIVDLEIKKELESIDGISNVDVSGGREKSVEIILDDEICEAYGITPSRISSLIRQNSASNTFVGEVRESGTKYFVNVIAEYRKISDIENITVIREGPVLMKDISEIYFGVKQQDSISRVNGKDAVTVNLVRDAQVNLIDLSHKTHEVISRLNRKFKDRDINIVVQNDTAEVMEKNIDLIIRLALIGGLIAVAILWIFLRNLRLVLIIALAIPISVFTAFNFFYAAGISVNSLTLIGMALAVGMLLDNSIVVLENIFRLKTAGKGADTAVIQGVKEVWRSVFAATLTTVTVFVPFIFSSNFLIQLIGKHIGVSIISTLLVSLLLALLLVPMVTHFFLVRRKTDGSANFRSDSGDTRLVEIYYVLLKSCLRFPLRTIIGTIVIFFASIIICFGISLNVTEEAESNSFSVYITMPEGATIETTDLTVADLEQRFETIPEREDIISDIREDEAVITISLKDGYQKIDGRGMQEIKEDIRKRFSGIQAASVGFDAPQSSRRFRGGGGGGMGRAMERMFGIGSQQEKVVIKGNDIEVMQNFAENIQYYLDNLGSISSTGMNVSENRPEIHLLFDTKVMSYYGITLLSIASELNSFENEYSSRMQFKQGADTYDIMISKKNQEDKNIEDLRTLPISGQAGGSVDLENLSRIIYSHGMPTINRVNQEKQVEITFEFSSDINSSKSMLEASRLEVDQLVSSLVIPSGLAVEVVHEENDYSEFKFLILVAFILIYMILASVFESLSTPVVMMFTIPLAAIGSFWLLIATGTSLINAYTLTGFLILLGVVVNNGIILIDYSLILMRRGYRRSRALMVAGKARTRPILITAITTIAAMIPLAMGKSEEITLIGAPFAITVIGGLTLSTVFTLIFIPVVFSGLESALSWIRSLNWKIRSAQILSFALGSLAIYFKATGTIWQMVFLAVLIFAIPGLTWFMLSSLRTAKKDIIAKNEPVRITIRNLVKIYDQPSRFVREWNKGKRKRNRTAENQGYGRDGFDSGSMIWKLPLLFFMIYFTYFYLGSPFWVFVLSHPVYFYTFLLWKPASAYLTRQMEKDQRLRMIRVISIIRPVFLWGIPFINLFIFWIRWHNIASLIFVAALWYFALVVYTTADRLQKEHVNIARISGRAAGLRKAFYYLVRSIPVIGKKKEAFRALSGVSLEIGEGMFGLLGPNGAGKTTLMRIICGILDQSYGRIDINGIDINEKREELQSLIGYLPQEFGMYENLTAWEFLNYQAVLKGLTDREYREKMVEKVLGMVHMEESRDKAISSFSGGMKQRVGIAQVLLHLPRILVVDEPTAGLDPRERIRFRNLLVELSRERIVIFSTHIIEDIYSSCNSVAVLNRGNLIYLDDPSRMAEIAEGHVWQFETDPEELELIRKEMMIVHHMRDGKKIRVRSLSKTKPHPDAKTVRPTLEDSYLWLLGTGGA